MKTKAVLKSFLIISSLLSFEFIFSQTPCNPNYGTYVVDIVNNTACDMWVSWEAGNASCEACMGFSGIIPANTFSPGMQTTAYNCNFPSCAPNAGLLWVLAEPVITGSCVVSAAAQEFLCSGSSYSGSGSSCCVNSWSINVVHSNLIEIN